MSGDLPENVDEREKMAKMLPHAPDFCEECTGRGVYVVRYNAGNHVRTTTGGGIEREYRESGEVACRECGHRMTWRVPG